MRNAILLVVAVVAASAGCQERRFLNLGRNKADREQAMLTRSVDDYAKKQGLSRDEAIRELRQKADATAAEDPARNGRAGVAQRGASVTGPAAPGAVGAGVYEVEDARSQYEVQPAAHFDAPPPGSPIRR